MKPQATQASITLFGADNLSHLPIFYRFMTVQLTAEVPELRTGARFSRSRPHRTDQFLNFAEHKPNSAIDFIDELIKLENHG